MPGAVWPAGRCGCPQPGCSELVGTHGRICVQPLLRASLWPAPRSLAWDTYYLEVLGQCEVLRLPSAPEVWSPAQRDGQWCQAACCSAPWG